MRPGLGAPATKCLAAARRAGRAPVTSSWTSAEDTIVTERPPTYSRVAGPTTHPDHHLWRNGRRWWIAFTYHTDDGRKHRVRDSLGTCDLAEARARRDERLVACERRHGCKLSLRFAALSSFDPTLPGEHRGGAA